MTVNQISFRKATQNDVPAIVALVESVYRGEKSKQGWTTEADILDGQRTDFKMVQDLMAGEDRFFLLAFEKDVLLASVQLERKAGYAYLGMLSVDVSAQNLKLGRRMLAESEKWVVKEWGLNEVRIVVIERRQELVAWYDRRGYQRTGRTIEFHNDPRFGIPKVDDLHLIEMSKPILLN